VRGVILLAGALAALVLSASSSAGKPPFPISKSRWLDGVQISEYYAAPERWFTGRKVAVPGLTGRHRVDWLYSSSGVAMEGDGIGLDGLNYHLSAGGTQGWVTAAGKKTVPTPSGWTRGWPFWRGGGWRNADGAVTFPLEAGGWYKAKGIRYIKPDGIRFSEGESRPLTPWRTIAVDPAVIPQSSLVFIPAYCPLIGHAWFKAGDIGGAISGRHIDVYRPAPAKPGGDEGFSAQRVYVIPAGVTPPVTRPTCASPAGP
jgi:3D (Asp-Asp-Asp) domain-containing protein